MKKNTIKAFTLVEMLIVIVIIGILIAALMPRMQSAQGRARDVSRKNALSQIQTAIVTSQQDKWNWPGMDDAKWAIPVSNISWALITAWMSSIPKDPLESNEVTWLNGKTGTWDYLYMVTKRNWTDDWWFVLMAKTEVEWWSNWIVCSNTWAITSGFDLKNIQLCTTFDKSAADTNSCSINAWKCTYSAEWELRYIVVY